MGRAERALVGIVVVGTIVLELLNGTENLSDDLEKAAVTLALALLPVSIGVAILRQRLYEIDRLISRTVSYAVPVDAADQAGSDLGSMIRRVP